MDNYLSGRGGEFNKAEDSESGNFSSYLSGSQQVEQFGLSASSQEPEVEKDVEVLHTDESGIKVEVLSVDGKPSNILIHIPDGRIIDLDCIY